MECFEARVMRSVNVYQAAQLFYGEEDAENEVTLSSSSEEEEEEEEESGVEDDEVTDPSFVAFKVEEDEDEEEEEEKKQKKKKEKKEEEEEGDDNEVTVPSFVVVKEEEDEEKEKKKEEEEEDDDDDDEMTVPAFIVVKLEEEEDEEEEKKKKKKKARKKEKKKKKEEEEDDDDDDEITVPFFISDDDTDDERYEDSRPSTRTPTRKRRRSPMSPMRSPRTPTRKRSRSPMKSPQAQPHRQSEPWRCANDPDTAPQISRFMPRRTPGAQVDNHATYSPLELFQLYFSPTTVCTLCSNTNKRAAKSKEMGKKYKWDDVETEELYKFIGLFIYTSLVSLPSITDYWKQNVVTSVPFPASVMSRDRFRALLWNIHPSDPEEDKKNDEKKGTPAYDKLFRIKPLIDDIRNACKAHYHPRRELAVDERMVATKAKTGMTQFMKDKPTRWGIKLFVLADSSNGYTVDFNIYSGKTETHSEHGLPYDAVMQLIQPSYLGTGYHVYVDNFYTSPRLFLDLANMKFGACGTYRDNTKGCPFGRGNALPAKSERGAIRWIREGSLVFVKWMDTREVSVCSTIHPAFSGEVVKRKVKEKDGSWGEKNIPCPAPIIAYNKHMGGVDLSDQLLQYYSTHRRTGRWYRTLFLHMVDIATTNAYLLHRDISASNQVKPMSHKDFQMELVSQLCRVDKTGKPTNRSADHVPVAIVEVTDTSMKATQGRRTCQHCNQVNKKRNVTPWKCQSCDVALCLVINRNCFAEWHK